MSTPRVAAIHDMSGFGRCSLTVAIPILSAMGIQCCPPEFATCEMRNPKPGKGLGCFMA